MEALAQQLLGQQMQVQEMQARLAAQAPPPEDPAIQAQARSEQEATQVQQLEQVLNAVLERLQANNEQILAAIQALASREQPAPIVNVSVPERAVTVNIPPNVPMEKIPERDRAGNIMRVLERPMPN